MPGVIFGIAIGMLVGVGAYTFVYARGFYVDFIESENSNGFHASQEAARILGESINFSRKGQIALR